VRDDGSGSAPSPALLRLLGQQPAAVVAAPQQPVIQVVPAPANFDLQPAPQGAVAGLVEGAVAPPQPYPDLAKLVSGGRVASAAPAWAQTANAQRAEAERQSVVQNFADMMNAQAAAGQRDAKRRQLEATDEPDTPVELSMKQWNAMTPQQQAAVQANADLQAAVQADFAGQKAGTNHATDAQFQAYTERVKELFGDNVPVGFKGLDYAPNTVAFLDSRGLGAADLTGTTLDDLIRGETLVSPETIQNLDRQVSPPDVFHTWPTDPREKNIAFAQRLAKGQLQFQEDIAAKLAKGDKLIAGLTQQSTRKAASEEYGAQAPAMHTRLTAVRPETQANFDIYMEALARTDSPIDKALAAISQDLHERGASQDEINQVYEGMIERARLGMTGEGAWFPGIDFPMRTPQEVAQALGVPTVKRAEAK
jgi:hypothetical protein